MEITRRQGRVVIVGYVKLDIHPKNFLYREIDLRYSRAYGPGQLPHRVREGPARLPVRLRPLDREPEPRGGHPPDLGRRDRPRAADRWGLRPRRRAVRVRRGTAGHPRWSRGADPLPRRGAGTPQPTLEINPRPGKDGTVGISLIGFGNHVLAQHLPNLRAMRNVEIRGIASATGRNAAALADKIDATIVTTDIQAVLDDPGTDGVLISTIQPEHYDHLCHAIEADKAILVEKPMVTRRRPVPGHPPADGGQGHPADRRPEPPVLTDDPRLRDALDGRDRLGELHGHAVRTSRRTTGRSTRSTAVGV